METTVNGPAGVFAARLVGAVTRSESELATIRFLPMVGKIATSRDWDPVRNALIALSDLVHWTEATMIGQLGPHVQCRVAAA